MMRAASSPVSARLRSRRRRRIVGRMSKVKSMTGYGRAVFSVGGTDFSAEKPPRAVVFSAMLRYAEELAHTRGDAGSENVRWLLARLHPFTCGVPGGGDWGYL